MMRLSPYPGLRPFQIEEHDLFFGREEQVDELLRRLRNTRFLAIVGPSGCGKSSLVRAGMMAALETGYLVTAGSEWRFAAMRPGRQPMRRLAEALVRSAGLAPADLDATLARDLIKHTLERGPRGLVEVLDGTPLPAGTNLLVLVDQFEEIFRFRREGDLDEANAFVALLLESAALQAHSVYVVITMRSDFFGDCAVFTGLPEAINKSQYLTPRLTREQRQAAIVGPARVFGGDVEPELVNRLLNDMGTDPDQLPVLQHLLMRMWTWRPGAATSGSARLVQPGEERPGDPGGERRTLTMHDYESVGGFANALSNHAEEAFAKLGEGQQRIAEILLRRLSERGPDNRDIRRPTPAGEVAALAGVSVDEVTQVADVFRAPDCSFLVPPWPEPIHPYTVLDISHESFLRQWGRLKGWIDAEAKSVDAYRFLEQTARHWKQRRAALWGTPNLELAVAWREEERPTVEWAKRYGGDFAAAMDFLTASEQAHRAEAARKEARRKASLRRLRRVAAGFAGLSLLLAAGIGYYLYDQVLDHAAYFNTFVKKKGVAEGYGPLTEKQRKARLISLKVVRQGRSGPVKFIEAVNANDGDRCDPRHKIGTILPFKQPDSPSHKECRWKFVRDARGDIAYELAFNQF
ncbi:MAG: ATP-binding protein, partial [Burkholderiaceae bacterium]